MVENQSEPRVWRAERDTDGDTGSECPSVLLDKVDSIIPVEFRDTVRDLLRQFTTMFSKGKNEWPRNSKWCVTPNGYRFQRTVLTGIEASPYHNG